MSWAAKLLAFSVLFALGSIVSADYSESPSSSNSSATNYSQPVPIADNGICETNEPINSSDCAQQSPVQTTGTATRAVSAQPFVTITIRPAPNAPREPPIAIQASQLTPTTPLASTGTQVQGESPERTGSQQNPGQTTGSLALVSGEQDTARNLGAQASEEEETVPLQEGTQNQSSSAGGAQQVVSAPQPVSSEGAQQGNSSATIAPSGFIKMIPRNDFEGEPPVPVTSVSLGEDTKRKENLFIDSTIDFHIARNIANQATISEATANQTTSEGQGVQGSEPQDTFNQSTLIAGTTSQETSGTPVSMENTREEMVEEQKPATLSGLEDFINRQEASQAQDNEQGTPREGISLSSVKNKRPTAPTNGANGNGVKTIPSRSTGLGTANHVPKQPKYRNNMQIPNTEKCTDSDGGIFADVKGTITCNGVVVAEDKRIIIENGMAITDEYFVTNDDPKGYYSFKITFPVLVKPRQEIKKPEPFTCPAVTFSPRKQSTPARKNAITGFAPLHPDGKLRDVTPLKTEVQGVLEVWEKPHLGEEHEVDGDGFEYYINTGKELRKAMLSDSFDTGEATSGTRVKATGITTDNYLVVEERAGITVKSLTQEQTRNIGPQRVAVILTKPVGGQNPLVPKLADAMQKVKEFYAENSSGKTSIVFDATTDVYGPYEVVQGYPKDTPDETYEFDQSSWIQASDKDVDFKKYSFVMIIDERNPTRGSLGRAYRQTQEGQVQIGITHMVPDDGEQYYQWKQWMMHELGHNFGAWHSGRVNCGDKPIDVPEKCKTGGDVFDVMGSGFGAYSEGAGHLSPVHKKEIGWLEGKIKYATVDGEYSIKSHITNNGEPVVLEVPRRGTDGTSLDSYYIERRSKNGFDKEIFNGWLLDGVKVEGTGTKGNDGLLVRFKHVEGSPYGASYLPTGTSLLIPIHYDPDPFSYYLNNLALLQGETFVGMDGVVITAKQVTDEGATIEVRCLYAGSEVEPRQPVNR